MEIEVIPFLDIETLGNGNENFELSYEFKLSETAGASSIPQTFKAPSFVVPVEASCISKMTDFASSIVCRNWERMKIFLWLLGVLWGTHVPEKLSAAARSPVPQKLNHFNCRSPSSPKKYIILTARAPVQQKTKSHGENVPECPERGTCKPDHMQSNTQNAHL